MVILSCRHRRCQPIAVDLFCGCGGLTQGLKGAGFRVVAAVDVDPLAVQMYNLNHPEVSVRVVDIRHLDAWCLRNDLNLAPGELDLLAGCPPCQGFSSMRTLNGARSVVDPRNDLLFEFERFVQGFLPKAVMIENVPGLARDQRFESFIRFMQSLGYRGEHRILNAADYGVPQRRRRLIYVAGLGTSIGLAPPSGHRVTVRETIGSLPTAGRSGDRVHDMPERRSQRVRDLIRRIPADGGSRSDLPEDCQLECHKKCDGFKDVYGRIPWDGIAPTITSGCFNPSKGRFLHPTEDRAITIREAALLQGFPQDYQFPQSAGKIALALLIGNALPPPFVQAHALQIRKVLAMRLDRDRRRVRRVPFSIGRRRLRGTVS